MVGEFEDNRNNYLSETHGKKKKVKTIVKLKFNWAREKIDDKGW